METHDQDLKDAAKRLLAALNARWMRAGSPAGIGELILADLSRVVAGKTSMAGDVVNDAVQFLESLADAALVKKWGGKPAEALTVVEKDAIRLGKQVMDRLTQAA